MDTQMKELIKVMKANTMFTAMGSLLGLAALIVAIVALINSL